MDSLGGDISEAEEDMSDTTSLGSGNNNFPLSVLQVGQLIFWGLIHNKLYWRIFLVSGTPHCSLPFKGAYSSLPFSHEKMSVVLKVCSKTVFVLLICERQRIFVCFICCIDYLIDCVNNSKKQSLLRSNMWIYANAFIWNLNSLKKKLL